MDSMFTAGQAALISDGIALALLVCLLVNALGKRKIAGKEWFILRAMIYITMTIAVVEPCTYFLNKVAFPGAYVIDLILNSILFAGIAAFSCFWAKFVFLRAKGEKHYDSHPLTLFYISLLSYCVYILLIVNFFVPVVFRIDPETLAYSRITPGFVACYASAYLYLIAGIAFSYQRKNKRRQYLLGEAVTFVFPMVVVSVIQFFVEEVSLLPVGAALSLTTAYFYLQDERAFIDPLSGLFNHLYMNRYIASNLKGNGQKLGGIMIDLDGFKSINDNYGHLAGDDAIRQTGELLKNVASWNELCFRFAGDEFCILVTGRDETEVQGLIARLREAAKERNAGKGVPYPLSFSAGYTMSRDGDTVDSFISRMDEEMYKNKKERKSSGVYGATKKHE